MTLEEVIEDSYYCDYDEKFTPNMAKAIRKWIKERLPNEKTFNNPTTSGQIDWMLGYNQCLKDIYQSLGEE